MNIKKEYLPVWRNIGKYSGNPRDLDKEYNEYREPDLDDPEAWLEEERFEPDFNKHVEKSWAYLWNKIDFDGEQFYMGGQSHIDIAWLWRYFQTLRKVIVTYKKAVWHVFNHERYTFAGSQVLLMDWIMREDPGLFDEIKAAVKTGRFDLVGGFWVEPDCHLPSGESFVRQRLYGQLFYLKHFGKISDVEWVPDSFGFASTLPQIIRKSGSRYFYTTKLHGNKYTPFPFVNFRWRSPDGSEVIASNNPGGFSGISAHERVKARKRLLKPGSELVADYTVDAPEDLELYSEEIPPPVAFIGKGDGGHGPTGEEVAVMDLFLEKGKGVRWITPTMYYQELMEPFRDRLPVWADELYYEFHRGTITTHNLVKRMNRYFEWRLCALESLLSVASLLKGHLDVDWNSRVEAAWKLVLLNQFHDVLPGSSIPEAYDDCYDIWEYTKLELDGLEDLAWSLIGQKTPAGGGSGEDFRKSILLFNGTGFDLKDVVVEIPANGLGGMKSVKSVVHDNGRSEPAQILEGDSLNLDEVLVKRPDRVTFKVDIPQHGFKRVELAMESPESSHPVIDVNDGDGRLVMESDLYKVTVDGKVGTISSIIFKDIGKDVLTGPGIQLNAFFDWLPDEPCWNIMPTYREMAIEMNAPVRVELVEQGPLKWTVELEWEFFNEDSEAKMNGRSKIICRISLVAGAPGIFVDFLMDWHSCEVIMKLDINTSTGASTVVAEVPYGTNARSTRPVANHDVPRWENYNHTWLDMPSADGTWGLAVINKGKYGYDAVGERIGLTVVRGPKYPAPAYESWVKVERELRKDSGGGPVPTHADQGLHLIQYMIVPHSGTWFDSKPFIPMLAHAFNEGVISRTGTLSAPAPDLDASLISTGTRNAEIAVVKHAENSPGYVFRVNEVLSTNAACCKVSLHASLGVRDIVETDLLERPLAETEFEVEKDTAGNVVKISFQLRPHEIKTFLMKLG
ncbi:MAG: alpha-mannosidase [Promethearchaeota archaeon]